MRSHLENKIPLSLYIHIPWCAKKCPYCDFNSYALGKASASERAIPETAYIEKLEQDLLQDLLYAFNRPLQSIFFGGGTPSLFSPISFEKILNFVGKRMAFASNIEITMEANPGTLEHKDFKDYKAAGINRISLGAQSFQDEKLKALGRIHQSKELYDALESLDKAELYNFNIDIMHGLPNQTLNDAIYDLEQALSFQPSHLSWYHLTLEPNTYFHKYPPILPSEDTTDIIQSEGLTLLKSRGYRHYEVSAFAKLGSESRHNLNYWTFGDYLGIGAGAHGKLSDPTQKVIYRTAKTRSPISYLNNQNDQLLSEFKMISESEYPFEFMLNALRLTDEAIPFVLFEERCFLSREVLFQRLTQAEKSGFLVVQSDSFILTEFGKRYLNDVIKLFLPNE